MKKILVPTDFSKYSKHAYDYALKFGVCLKAEIKLFHSFLDPILGSPIPMYDFGEYEGTHNEIMKNTEDQVIKDIEMVYRELNEKIEKEKLDGVNIVKYHIANGFPEEEIVNFSNSYKPDLIVMGTKGKGGVIKDLFGSVTEKIVENAKVPVLTIPETPWGGKIEKILYATDFDESDFEALKKLEHFIKPLKAKLYVVHTCFGEKLEKDYEQMKKLKLFLDKEYKNIDIQFDIIECEDVLKCFDDYIEDKQIDIISVTTHKRNIFTKLLNPSFTKKMLFHSSAPLLVFHAE
ncbi:MAG: universal stress protein [Bacteroidales bacterium]|nr:universal stress protein [Bacteroidales bacterium]